MTKKDRAKLDREVSVFVRSRGSCQRCGKTQSLQCCHIFSRRYLVLRHNLANLLCLCAGCHFWAHHNPIEFTRWVESNIGRAKMDELIRLKNEVIK